MVAPKIAWLVFAFYPANAMRRMRSYSAPSGLNMNAFVKSAESFMQEGAKPIVGIERKRGAGTHPRSSPMRDDNETNRSMFSDSLKLLFWSIDSDHDNIVSDSECMVFSHHSNCFSCMRQLFPEFFTTPDDVCHFFVTPVQKSGKHGANITDYEEELVDLAKSKGGKGGKGARYGSKDAASATTTTTAASATTTPYPKSERRRSASSSKRRRRRRGGKGGKGRSLIDLEGMDSEVASDSERVSVDQDEKVEESVVNEIDTSLESTESNDGIAELLIGEAGQGGHDNSRQVASLIQERSGHEANSWQAFEGSELDRAMGTKGCI